MLDSVDDLQKEAFRSLFKDDVNPVILSNKVNATTSKSRNDNYKIVDVHFRNGKRSLIQLDNHAYERFLTKFKENLSMSIAIQKLNFSRVSQTPEDYGEMTRLSRKALI